MVVFISSPENKSSKVCQTESVSIMGHTRRVGGSVFNSRTWNREASLMSWSKLLRDRHVLQNGDNFDRRCAYLSKVCWCCLMQALVHQHTHTALYSLLKRQLVQWITNGSCDMVKIPFMQHDSCYCIKYILQGLHTGWTYMVRDAIYPTGNESVNHGLHCTFHK